MGESNKEWPRDWTPVEVQGVSSGLVIYEKKYFANGGVARLTFHNEIRPGINALRDVMGRELRILLSDANYDPSIGVVVITSYGEKSFLAGGDVSWEAAGGLVEQIELGLADSQASMRRCRKPIICAVKVLISPSLPIMPFSDKRGPEWEVRPTATSSATFSGWSAPRKPGKCGCSAAATTRRRPCKWGWSMP